MGKDFYENFSRAKETFEEANDILGKNISELILNGPEDTLTETKNCQAAILVVSVAILRVVQQETAIHQPRAAAGLSLGEYTALHAAGYCSFETTLKLVQKRGALMHAVCDATEGSMAVILGLSAEEVETLVRDANLPNDLWAANFNCPGQIVLSGTELGIKKGTAAALASGAKRVLPLNVHGAFHSGLMLPAEEKLRTHILEAPFNESTTPLVMNATGKAATDLAQIKELLAMQVSHPVRWEAGIHTLEEMGVDRFVEMGCGKTLAGFNKRIGTSAPTVTIETVEDLKKLD